MTPSPLSVHLLNFATLGYLFAMVFAVLFAVSRKTGSEVGVRWVAGISLLLHLAALIERWRLGGLYRPPWTNLYESLIYFSFGLAAVGWIVDFKYRVRFLNLFIYPLVFSGLGLAFLVPVKEITPLVPALQSWWILAHSCLAAFAYSGFIVASVLAFLYLIKVQIDPRFMGGGTALMIFLAMLLVGGGEVFGEGIYRMTESVFWEGRWIPNPIPGTNPPKFFEIEVPFVAPLFWATTVCAFFAGIFFIQSKYSLTIWGRRFLVASLVGQILILGKLFWIIGSYQSLTLGSNPYSLTLLILFAALSLFSVLVLFYGESIAARLPEADWLDNLSYKVTLFAFPFMTLILITGAIWAHEAWGRYWGWDPKETTALVTWLIYAGYLHARLTPGWRGHRAALLSLIGFFSVLFTYLGTNLVLSGLHSYGSR